MKKTISNMEKIRYEKYSEMGMETINAFYKGVFMNLAEGDDWCKFHTWDKEWCVSKSRRSQRSAGRNTNNYEYKKRFLVRIII